ncbi:MAG: hypothetical protein Q7S37_03540 [bacterium]|nr:hypothetical protein [bacterium]
MSKKIESVCGLLRLSLGWVFLWAFIDKLWGLGFATTSAKSWLSGGSPTLGFLKFGTHGPFASFYQGIAGNSVVDWLFMLGLLALGLALILGIGIKIASYVGTVLLLLMWSAALPPANNPFLDEHIIYILILIGLASANAGQYLGFGRWWSTTGLVKKHPFLQ